MGVSRFQELVAWQLCVELADVMLEMTEAASPASKDVNVCEQIRRAADAAAPLIAEGFLRFSHAEFARYLRMTRGELGEVQTLLEAARRRHYFSPDQLARAEALAERALKTTTALLKSQLPHLRSQR